MGEPRTLYFPDTHPDFEGKHARAHDAILQGKFFVTGQGKCTADYIAGNSDGHNTLEANPNICNWSRLYDFSRTAHRSMRSHMLSYMLQQ